MYTQVAIIETSNASFIHRGIKYCYKMGKNYFKNHPMKGNINTMTCCMAKASILMLYVYLPVASSWEKARL